MIIIVIYLCFRSWQQKVEEDRRDILELARKLQELCRFRVSETILGWNYTRSIKRSRMEGVDTKQVGEQMYRRRHFWPGFSEQFKEGRVIFQKTSFWTKFFSKNLNFYEKLPFFNPFFTINFIFGPIFSKNCTFFHVSLKNVVFPQFLIFFNPSLQKTSFLSHFFWKLQSLTHFFRKMAFLNSFFVRIAPFSLQKTSFLSHFSQKA